MERICIRLLRRCSPGVTDSLLRLAPEVNSKRFSWPAPHCNLHTSLCWLYPRPVRRTIITQVSIPSDQDLGLGPSSRRLQGRYQIGNILGDGAFGVVIAGRDVDSGERVAIKVLSKEYFMAAPERRVPRFMTEIAAVTRLKHPYITRLVEMLHDIDTIYLVMEFVPGGDLKSRMKYPQVRVFPEDEARKLFQQIIDAVGYCHDRGVFHGDMKPSNVLLAANGDAKVCDFGLSELLWGENSDPDGRIRTTGGTLQYLAPEALTSTPAGYDGAPVDVWACGCTLYSLVIGRSPFAHLAAVDSDRALRAGIYGGHYIKPRHLSTGLLDLISRCLQPDFRRRITIPDIYRHRWFVTNYRPPDFTKIPDIKDRLDEMEAAFGPRFISGASAGGSGGAAGRTGSGHKPRRLDAFELLAQAPGFDLAPLIQNPKDSYSRVMKSDFTRFTSLFPPHEIMDTIEDACTALGCAVQIVDYKMMVRRATAGRKEPLCLSMEVAKVATGAYMVEVRRVTGGPREYHKFLGDFTSAIKDSIVQVPGPAEQSGSINE